MAHVFANPTYRNAVANKVARHIIVSSANSGEECDEVIKRCGMFKANYSNKVTGYLLDRFCLEEDAKEFVVHANSSSDVPQPSDDQLLLLYLAKNTCDVYKSSRRSDFIRKIIGNKPWVSDATAQREFLRYILTSNDKIVVPRFLLASTHKALTLAHKWMNIQSPALKLSQPSALAFFASLKSAYEAHVNRSSTYMKRLAVSIMMQEVLISRCSREPDFGEPINVRRNNAPIGAHMCLTEFVVYKVPGLIAFSSDSCTYFFDNKHLAQLSETVMFWANYDIYPTLFRVCGKMGQSFGNFREASKRVEKWVISRIGDKRLAKDIKQSMARTFNDIHAKFEGYDVHWEKRSSEYVINAENDFYSFVITLPIPDRLKIDLAHIYHGIPADDADMFKVIKSMMEKAEQENHVEENDTESFLDYCRTFDLARVALKYKDRIKGYIYEKDSDKACKKIPGWVQTCIDGHATMPNEEEYGKYCIKNFFPNAIDINTWYLNAGDVTYVNDQISTKDSIPYEENELLYVLENGRLMSHFLSPSQVIAACDSASRRLKWVTQATLAAKKENTKFEETVRETISPSCSVREVGTAHDFNAILLSRALPGIALRADAYEVNNQFRSHLKETIPGRKSVIVSTDVSGWSPRGNRDAMLKHHEYLQSMCINKYNVRKFWDGIIVRSLKHGANISFTSKKGMFQGWTGTSDTVLHTHIIGDAIRGMKKKGILLEDEYAEASTLIDDAVISLKISDERNAESQQQVIDLFFNEVKEAYKKNGMELDEGKTIVSSFKYVFLNQMFMAGSEIMAPMKTFCRIGKAGERDLRSVHDAVTEVFSQSSAAVAKGFDPIAGYFHSYVLAASKYFAALRNAPSNDSSNLLKMVLPSTIGGFGVPTMFEFLTSIIDDRLVHISEVFYACSKSVHMANLANISAHCYKVILCQEYMIKDTASFISNPRDLRTDAPSPPWEHLSSKILTILKKKKLCEEFSVLMRAHSSKPYNESIELFLKSGIYDASILENMANALPHVIMEAILSKFHRNFTILAVFNSREKRFVMRNFRKQDLFFTKYVIREFKELDMPSEILPYNAFLNIRNKLFENRGYRITNHTLADPSAVLGHTARQDVSYVEFLGIKSYSEDKDNSIWGSNFECYNNMYDGVGAGLINVPRRAADSLSTHIKIPPIGDVITKTLVRNKALRIMEPFIYGVMPGSLSKLERLILASWSLDDVQSPSELKVTDPTVVSTKRISSTSSSNYYDIKCFRNTVTSFRFNDFTVRRTWDRNKVHMDLLKVHVAITVVSCLDQAILQHPIERRHFDIKSGFMAFSDPVACQILDVDAAESAIATMRTMAPISKNPSLQRDIDRAVGRAAQHVALENTDVVDHCEEAAPESDVAHVNVPVLLYYACRDIECGMRAVEPYLEMPWFKNAVDSLKSSGILSSDASSAYDMLKEFEALIDPQSSASLDIKHKLASVCPPYIKDYIAASLPNISSDKDRLAVSEIITPAFMATRHRARFHEMLSATNLDSNTKKIVRDIFHKLWDIEPSMTEQSQDQVDNDECGFDLDIEFDDGGGEAEERVEEMIYTEEQHVIAAWHDTQGDVINSMRAVHGLFKPIIIHKSFLTTCAEEIENFKMAISRHQATGTMDVKSPEKKKRRII